MNTPAMNADPPRDNCVTTSAIYGLRTRQPLVQHAINDHEPILLDPAAARAVAQGLLEAATAAEQDAFMFEFATEKMGSSDEQAASLMALFREWRNR